MKISELYKYFIKFPNIPTDSRNIKKNSIFFALKGENFNGNRYASQAIDNGCKYAVIDDKKFQLDNRFLLVNDALESLQDLAKHHREQLTIPIIAITGTNGKTTSKELINCCLTSKFKTVATIGNYNNHIGVPLTILGISKEHQIAIVEMGANHEKEIDFLCTIAQPNYGIITDIGKAHIEGFKSTDGVKRAKKELYDYIYKKNGKVFVNNDDHILKEISKDIDSISYGKNGDTKGKIHAGSFFINILYDKHIIKTNLIGNYQFYNIMLAICVAKHFQIHTQKIANALSIYKPQNNRSQVINSEKNTIILDAYNANPSSMKEMLESFASIDKPNKICILGDMAELGEVSEKEHTIIAQLIKKLNITTYFIGKEFAKLKIKNAFLDVNDFNTYISKSPIHESTILIKGSRSIKLEETVRLL
jgi:UDP-N-acetylmuramoyl-tripeptide--D-alanyl-D-alanine ligase